MSYVVVYQDDKGEWHAAPFVSKDIVLGIRRKARKDGRKVLLFKGTMFTKLMSWAERKRIGKA